MLSWRNWYTRMVEVHVPKGLGVRVSPRAPGLGMVFALIMKAYKYHYEILL